MRVPVAAVLVFVLTLSSAHAKRRASTHPEYEPRYTTQLIRWTSAENAFASWEHAGTRVNAAGELELDVATAVSGADPYGAGGWLGANYYNGASFLIGEATSPIVHSAIPFRNPFATWNASTPHGAWIEAQARVRVNGVWQEWYSWGVWDDDNSTVARHSWSPLPPPAREFSDAAQVRLRLFSEFGTAVPTVRNAGITLASAPLDPPARSSGNPAHWNRVLDVPQCSQMLYTAGSTRWCSPASTAMVLSYFLGETGNCEARVRAAASGVYDWARDQYGFWAFSAAYASTFGFNAYATQLSSMAEIEEWIARGVPVVFSFSWNQGQLTGAPLPVSAGHLAVIVGFDAEGNPIVNDPAAPSDDTVRRTYLRSELETLWLRHSGGGVYLIYPDGFDANAAIFSFASSD